MLKTPFKAGPLVVLVLISIIVYYLFIFRKLVN